MSVLTLSDVWESNIYVGNTLQNVVKRVRSIPNTFGAALQRAAQSDLIFHGEARMDPQIRTSAAVAQAARAASLPRRFGRGVDELIRLTAAFLCSSGVSHRATQWSDMMGLPGAAK